MTMNNLTEQLEGLLKDSYQDLEGAVSIGDPTLVDRIQNRVQEIRNILTVTKSWDSEPPTGENMAEYLDDVKVMSERVRGLVDDRLSAGQHERHIGKKFNL